MHGRLLSMIMPMHNAACFLVRFIALPHAACRPWRACHFIYQAFEAISTKAYFAAARVNIAEIRHFFRRRARVTDDS